MARNGTGAGRRGIRWVAWWAVLFALWVLFAGEWTALVAVWGAAWLPSRRLMLLGLGTVGVVAGSWIGGELVFRHGWRVRAAEEAELVESRLQAEGRPDYFDQARAEVSDFERSKTILGG